ncbi:MAG: NifU family protein [Pseudomonadota bacterium]
MVTEQSVRDALDEIRPALQADGGDVELVKLEGNDVHVRLVGACAGCPGATMTLLYGVTRVLKERVPDLGEVIPA